MEPKWKVGVKWFVIQNREGDFLQAYSGILCFNIKKNVVEYNKCTANIMASFIANFINYNIFKTTKVST